LRLIPPPTILDAAAACTLLDIAGNTAGFTHLGSTVLVNPNPELCEAVTFTKSLLNDIIYTYTLDFIKEL
jgi:hypothetical protein